MGVVGPALSVDVFTSSLRPPGITYYTLYCPTLVPFSRELMAHTLTLLSRVRVRRVSLDQGNQLTKALQRHKVPMRSFRPSFTKLLFTKVKSPCVEGSRLQACLPEQTDGRRLGRRCHGQAVDSLLIDEDLRALGRGCLLQLRG